MIQVVSTDILIKKNLNHNQDLKLLSLTISDDTGYMSAIFKNDHINLAKIGNQLIIRNAHIEFIDGYILLTCDENTNIYENKNNMVEYSKVETNYSKIKINLINYDLI